MQILKHINHLSKASTQFYKELSSYALVWHNSQQRRIKKIITSNWYFGPGSVEYQVLGMVGLVKAVWAYHLIKQKVIKSGAVLPMPTAAVKRSNNNKVNFVRIDKVL